MLEEGQKVLLKLPKNLRLFRNSGEDSGTLQIGMPSSSFDPQ